MEADSSNVNLTFEVMCSDCKERPGVIDWYGEGGTLAFTHGWIQAKLCERCALLAQLAYARAQAERIPELEQQLRELDE